MAAEDENRKLSDIFDEGLDLFNRVSKTDEATNSSNVQAEIKKCMHLLEDATRLVSLAGIFSSNESVEEVPTSNIKYFLMPALLGTLSLKLCVADRLEVITTAEVYFRDFLQRVKDYGVADIEIPPAVEIPDEDSATDMVNAMHTNRGMDVAAMARQRFAKIERFKQQKELESQMQTLRKAMENETVDEDIKRNYFLTMCKSFASQALDELSCLDSEKPLLAHRANLKKQEALGKSEDEHEREKRPKYTPRRPLMPVIITKDEVQKRVFGAGYPSLPTMTVQEFYEQRINDGIWKPPGQGQSMQNMAAEEADGLKEQIAEQEAAAKEEKVEADDPELLAQARNWDDYKDTHRTGWGNRMNRS
ncbi:immunoglobulin-binding protein 1 [Thrips palmi]|uniref:Immunoglobulin-binding protein 1 n=1 Tax=Thrips palmi TaxID=161013 RepID=A0A6P9A932_THRPL|nr:immunoglobulin-binding protein 1 [Thrips palmi]